MARLEEIEKQYLEILTLHKNSDDISSFTSALIFMSGILIVALLMLFILNGYSSNMLVVVLTLLLMFIIYRIRMAKATERLERHDTASRSGELSRETIESKLAYLPSGIQLKLERVKSVKLFYAVTFPFFLLVLQELFLDPVSTPSLIITLTVLLLMSTLVWSWFFSSDIKELERIERILKQLYKETAYL